MRSGQYRSIGVVILLLAFLSGRNLNAQEGYEVRDIIFTGNEEIPTSQLEEQISMFTVSWFNRTFLGKDPFQFDQNTLENDISALQHFYHTEGFLKAAIDPELRDIDDEDRHLVVVFQIREAEPVRVDQVTLAVRSDSADNSILADTATQEVRRQLILTTGKRFRDELLKNDQNRMIRYFTNHGYPYAQVEFDLQIRDKSDNVDIAWKINTGPLSTFGDIIIEGNKVVDEQSIREQLAFQKGELFQQQLIDTSHRDVYSLGMFKSVSMHALLDRHKGTPVPVKVEVQEAPALMSRFGAGFGTEEKFRAFVDLTYLGFLGNTRRLSLFVKHSSLEPYNVNLQFTQPAFIHPRASLQINPFLRSQDEPGYKVNRRGAQTSLIYDFSERIFTSLSYVYENVTQDTISEVNYYTESTYDKQMFVVNFSTDQSMPRFDPDYGYYIGINTKFNGFLFKTRLPFNKVLLDLRKFHKVAGMVFGVRLKLGLIEPVAGNEFVPVEERFYSGGVSSIRGWARAELGPMDEQGNPVGGNSLFESSLELRFPVAEPLYGAFFVDFGNVWEPSFELRLNDLRYSAGAGLRYATFIGPVRLDVARPVFDTARTWQIHFSVGHAF